MFIEFKCRLDIVPFATSQTVFHLVFSRIARYSNGVLQSDSYDFNVNSHL